MRTFSVVLVTCLALAGCLTMSGNYVLTARDKAGNDLTAKMHLTAAGRNIYSVRNALCKNLPGAVVIITDAKTGEELKSESPYQCP
jgi:hypothetical protein